MLHVSYFPSWILPNSLLFRCHLQSPATSLSFSYFFFHLIFINNSQTCIYGESFGEKKNIGLHLILCFFFSFQNLKLHIGSFFLTFIYHAIPALLSEMGAKGLFFFFFFNVFCAAEAGKNFESPVARVIY